LLVPAEARIYPSGPVVVIAVLPTSIPAPMRLMLLFRIRVVDQLQLPDGTLTVSPLFAEPIAEVISATEQLDAFIVAEFALEIKKGMVNKYITTKYLIFLFILYLPSNKVLRLQNYFDYRYSNMRMASF
jgi:hypothetical protein